MNYKLYTIIFLLPYLRTKNNNTVNAYLGYAYVIADNPESAKNHILEQMKIQYPDGNFEAANILVEDYTDRFFNVANMIYEYNVIPKPKKENWLRRFSKRLFKKSDQNIHLTANPVCKCCGK